MLPFQRGPHHPPSTPGQELRQERAARERLVSDSAGRDAAHAQARGQVAALSAERNSLSALVDSLKGQLAAKGAELAGQLEAAASLAAEKAGAEARAREADRAKTRLELDVAQLKQVRVGCGCGGCRGVARGERGAGRERKGASPGTGPGALWQAGADVELKPKHLDPILTLKPPKCSTPNRQQVTSLNEQLAAANDALDAKASDLLALQRASSDSTLKLQREMAELQAALADVRGAEEAASRRAAAAEAKLASSHERQAEVEANAAELEASLGDQLRAALAQAERYRMLAASEGGKREEVGGWLAGWLGGSLLGWRGLS
jgi:chromosome segregation ATPase